MEPLPPAYSWLHSLASLPRMVAEAISFHGTVEAAGAANSPTIMRWAREVGGDVAEIYKADSIAWCGLFMAICARRAGKTLPPRPLWALDWLLFGSPAGQPALGDVLVFVRPGGGHVGLYVGEDADTFHVLGGNQSDRVCFTRIAKARLRQARRPLYRVAPATVRPFILAVGGRLSVNEA